MFHAFLPSQDQSLGLAHRRQPCRYVDEGLDYLLGALARRGVPRLGLRAKVFGGANGLVQQSAGVGQKNAEKALTALDELAIPVLTSDLGGEQGRKILYSVECGTVFVRRLRPAELALACA